MGIRQHPIEQDPAPGTGKPGQVRLEAGQRPPNQWRRVAGPVRFDRVWRKVPVVFKIALAWLPFFVVWVLFILTYAEEATLGDAVVSSAYTIAGAALLGVPVWWISGRVLWPERVHVPFYLFHLLIGSLYAFLWLSIGYLVAAIGSEERFVDMIRTSEVVGWQFLTGLWLYGFVAGTSYSVRTREQLRKQERVAARAEALAARAQLMALRSQLNPHFLFNALHSLSVLIQEAPAQAARAVDRLGELLRYALDETAGDEVLLAEEWMFTRTYLEVEQIRFGSRLEWKEAMRPEALACRVPPFCLQPLVENAVRHGIAPKPAGGTITVSARTIDGMLRLCVHDDGAGSSSSSVPRGGLGLDSLEQRLRSMYDGSASLSVTTAPDAGFEVVVDLPVRREDAPVHGRASLTGADPS